MAGTVDLGQMLRVARERRVPPGKDTKILTSWNGLILGPLAEASWVLNDQRYAEAARRACESAGISDFPAKIKAAQESKNFGDGHGLAAMQPARQSEASARIENQFGPLSSRFCR